MANETLGFRWQPGLQSNRDDDGRGGTGASSPQGAVQLLNLRPRFNVSGANLPAPRALLESPGGAGTGVDTGLMQAAMRRLFGQDPQAQVAAPVMTPQMFSGAPRGGLNGEVLGSALRQLSSSFRTLPGPAPGPAIEPGPPGPPHFDYSLTPPSPSPPGEGGGVGGSAPPAPPPVRGLFDDGDEDLFERKRRLRERGSVGVPIPQPVPSSPPEAPAFGPEPFEPDIHPLF